MSSIVVTDNSAINRVVVEDGLIRIVSVGTQGPPGSSSLRIGNATWAASMSIDWSNFDLIRVTLQADTTFTSFAPVTDGRRVILELTHDANGGHQVIWPASVRYSNSLPLISLSTNPNQTDRVGFIYNSVAARFDVMAVARGF